MTNLTTTQAIETIAAKIGESVYIDITKWHLYLAEAHLHTKVAEKVYPLIENHELSEEKVLSILRDIKVPLGGGKLEVSLMDLLPTQCQETLIDLLQEHQRNQ
ncbi:MAG: DUF3181 family protein [cyanobacterium endosymbiont of Rhopalodia musculus]|uniref:DUF3181 family protein n=1 Tax=cyanobacterium endosymbiont of Epithemia clementina EcSB TaxID=3034674 RepID=UPI00247FF62F|nr:DUF3181 family protein [cyanobacterium endosymbiont of Epithemia clementina EcSB]WGT67130.1 DUF3181 family protein [cyanobacterium endosymbiont of Epithemia clementina EcSB]